MSIHSRLKLQHSWWYTPHYEMPQLKIAQYLPSHQHILLLLVHIAQLYPICGAGDPTHARFVDAAEGVRCRLFVAMCAQKRIRSQSGVINRIDIICRALKDSIDIHRLNMSGAVNRIH